MGGIRQGSLQRNGFAGIRTDAAKWFSETRVTWGVVLGTCQKSLRKSSVVAETWTAKELMISLREPSADYSLTETEEELC